MVEAPTLLIGGDVWDDIEMCNKFAVKIPLAFYVECGMNAIWDAWK